MEYYRLDNVEIRELREERTYHSFSKMLRRGGKRIRMDEPPPEYDAPPMTPMTPASELQEPYTPYTPYTPNAETPLHQ
ncbi:hypothetical protein Pmani_004360 [Petrolisthes manimaculis]|uniref:Uncharacterized protein n=1 Tax=Petrolisthes manimaculis TaxID=1843537 RepID=A0AAE1QDV3_9EUCA|nr:hypothetical protein Pmani_004360 [Petrolisthes manimaculis]